MTKASGRHYRAFISYSHQDNRIDRRDGSRGRTTWADWLHEALERFEVPIEVEPTLATLDAERRLQPIFKDEDELPVSPDLGKSIEDALAASDALIVICSPRSAASLYCNEEIRLFKALGRGDRILPLIIAGEPGASGRQQGSFAASEECFAPALRFRVDADGQVLEDEGDVEPICADARDGTNGAEPSAVEWSLDRDGQQRVLLKLVAGLLGVSFDSLVQRDRRRKMEQERARARASAASLYATALRELDRGSASDAAPYLAAALRTHAESSAPRLMATALLDGRGTTDLGGVIRSGGAPVLCCAANAAFTRVAYGTLDGRVGVVSVPDRAMTRELGLPVSSGPVIRIAWGPSGDHLRAVGWDGDVFTIDPRRLAMAADDPMLEAPRHYESLPEAVLDSLGPGTDFAGTDHDIWSDYAGQPAWRGPRYRASVQIFALHPEARWFAAVMRDGVHVHDCRTFDRLTDQPIFEADGAHSRVTALTIDAGGARVAIVSSDGRLCVADVGQGHRETVRLNGDWSHDSPMSVAFDSTATTLFVGTREGFGSTLDASTLSTLATRRVHEGPVTAARCDPSGTAVLTGGDDGTLGIWRLPKLEPVGEPTRHERGVAELVPDPGGRGIVTAAYDGSIRLTRRLGEREGFRECFRIAASPLVIGPDVIAFATPDRTIRLTTLSGEHLRELPFDGVGEVAWAAFTSDGARLLVSTYEQFRNAAGVIESSRTKSRRYLVELAGGSIRELADFHTWPSAISPQGSRVVFSTDQRTLGVFDASSGEVRALDFTAPERIGRVFTDETGARALVAFGQGEARVVDLETGAAVCSLPAQLQPIEAAVFDSAHGMLVMAAEEAVSILDATTGERIAPPAFTGSENIEALALSPDGELLFVGGWGFAAIYDVKAGLPVCPPMDLAALDLTIVRAARFAPDGQTLVLTGERMGTARCAVGLRVPTTADVDGPALADLLEAAWRRLLNGSGVAVELLDDGRHLERLTDAVEARRGADTFMSGLLQRYLPPEDR